MRRLTTTALGAMAVMTILSFTNLFGLSIAGLAVFMGVAFFFISNAQEKRDTTVAGLDLGGVVDNLKDRTLWLWMVLPLVMNAVSIGAGVLFVPCYIEHVIGRASSFVSFDQMTLLLIVQLVVLALGEEIAWRAFFFNQVKRVTSVPIALIFSSILFALGHISTGEASIVAFDILFVFINSVLYGIIFLKSNNAWTSTLSHFAANVFSIILFTLIG